MLISHSGDDILRTAQLTYRVILEKSKSNSVKKYIHQLAVLMLRVSRRVVWSVDYLTVLKLELTDTDTNRDEQSSGSAQRLFLVLEKNSLAF